MARVLRATDDRTRPWARPKAGAAHPAGCGAGFRIHDSPGPDNNDGCGNTRLGADLGRTVAGEIGDKTQLLALLLAARLRKPLAIILGIRSLTLLNHALAGWLGTLVAHWLTPEALRWTHGRKLLRAVVAQAGHPTRSHRAARRCTACNHRVLPGPNRTRRRSRTVLLAADFHPLWPVVVGTTIGMLLANAAGGAPRQPVRRSPALARSADGGGVGVPGLLDFGCRCARGILIH